jgi:hypothetical protein
MLADSAVARPDWIPRRMAKYQRRSRSTRWLIRRPERLLGWWLFLALFSLLGIVLIVVMPVYLLPAFLVPAWLQLGVDFIYIPRAFRASRKQSGAVSG